MKEVRFPFLIVPIGDEEMFVPELCYEFPDVSKDLFPRN